jgi:cystathionine beta-lyase
MPYNFDQLIERRGTGSEKWDFYPADVLPMWVADMDFAAPDSILKALHQKIDHGVFGYEHPSLELRQTVCDRMHRLHGWAVTPKQVVAVPGLVAGTNLVCRAFGEPGDGVLVQTPAYPPFLSAPKNNKLVLQTTELTQVKTGRTFHYEIDYDAFEAAITPPNGGRGRTRLFTLCQPYNPVGQIYTREQLTRLAEICLRHNVIICSDEIHSELLLDGNRHVPMAALSPEVAERTITLVAPSKTFNVAGLVCGFVIIQNESLLKQFKAACEGFVHVNALGLVSALAAFRDDPQVNEWLAGLRRYLTANRDVVVDYVATRLPDLKTTVPQATYLGWLDCRQAGIDGNPYEFFLQKAKVALGDGARFGPGGQGFVRINFGCPRAYLTQALEQMKEALSALYETRPPD